MELKKALEIIYSLAEGNALRQDVAAGDDRLMEEYQRQQEAFAVVSTYLYGE